jgi:hypothetical protein
MKQLVEFPLEGGGSVVIEVDEAPGGMQRAANAGEVVAKAGQTFENAMDRVKPVAVALVSKLRSLGEVPDQVEVEFGLKFNAAAGMLVASAATEANFKVKLAWTLSP